MSQNEQGVLYPFRLSGSRMRQSAVNLRRQGQTVDAMVLVRRAAEQEDTPAAWLALAGELRQTSNWEAASRLLARVLSRDHHHPGAWVDMARCMQAMGQNALAVDCAYHQLQEDPWGREGDAARAVLAQLDVTPDAREPRRTQRMIHRGLNAWQSGDRTAGERCIRRALRIAAEPQRLLVTTAMLCMLEMDFDGALSYLCRALRSDPDDPRTLTALATLLHQLGKRRAARGLLGRAGKYADSVMAEDGFLTAAWAQDAWPEMKEYLAARLKRQPCRIPLLAAKATMYSEMDDVENARRLWREIIAIDPDDRSAATLLAASQQNLDSFYAFPGMLPRTERQRQLTELRMAAESLTMKELLRPGGRERRLTDWFVASAEAAERQAVQALLERNDPEIIPYLKELLCQPFLRYDVRQWALVRLAEMGCQEELLILAGDHYTQILCRKTGEGEKSLRWGSFMTELLKETRRHRQSSAIVRLAAELWQRMSEDDRARAGGLNRHLWCKAVETYFLCTKGEDEAALRTMQDASCSQRRIRRILRRIHRYMTKSSRPMPENGDTA
ncbi:MAG: hypothetical protein IKL25_06755 [Clostridia bacterium]|nr:hypothetical protein [Clostridia bacterium]